MLTQCSSTLRVAPSRSASTLNNQFEPRKPDKLPRAVSPRGNRIANGLPVIWCPFAIYRNTSKLGDWVKREG